MYKLLFESQKNNRKKPALHFVGRDITYGQLFNEVEALCCAFRKYGCEKGDVVTLALPNIPSAVTLFYAVNKLGMTVNLVHPLLPAEKIIRYAVETKSKFLFVFDKLADGYVSKLLDCPVPIRICQAQDYITPFERLFYNLFTLRDRKNLRKNKTDYLKFKYFRHEGARLSKYMINRFAGNDDDVAAIMHSGGTSAEPKSILLTNANFNSVAVNTKRAIVGERAKEKDAMAMVLPMFHAFGLGVCVHTVLCGGVKSTLIPRYSPERIVHYLKQGHITMISGVPTMYRGLVNKKEFNCRQLKNLRFAFCGGDIFSDELKKDFDSIMARRKSPCVLDNGFGLTEVTGVFSVNKAGARRDGSCGRPIGEDYLIEAFDDNGQKLARGKSGELCISSASVMKGYMNDRQATEQTFLECDGKRWLKTGDWGFVDADGFIFVQQRLKRIIKVSGVPVFPAEIERLVGELKDVDECCAVGIDHKLKGKVVKLYVKSAADPVRLKKTVREFCRLKLDKWSCPKAIEVLPELPKTLMAKTDYRLLERNGMKKFAHEEAANEVKNEKIM